MPKIPYVKTFSELGLQDSPLAPMEQDNSTPLTPTAVAEIDIRDTQKKACQELNELWQGHLYSLATHLYLDHDSIGQSGLYQAYTEKRDQHRQFSSDIHEHLDFQLGQIRDNGTTVSGEFARTCADTRTLSHPPLIMEWAEESEILHSQLAKHANKIPLQDTAHIELGLKDNHEYVLAKQEARWKQQRDHLACKPVLIPTPGFENDVSRSIHKEYIVQREQHAQRLDAVEHNYTEARSCLRDAGTTVTNEFQTLAPTSPCGPPNPNLDTSFGRSR